MTEAMRLLSLAAEYLESFSNGTVEDSDYPKVHELLAEIRDELKRGDNATTVLDFEVIFPGEPAAGLQPYNVGVQVVLDPVETNQELLNDLMDVLRMALREVYDGAKVLTKNECDAMIAKEESG